MRGINLHEDWGWGAAPRIGIGAAALIGGGSALSAGSSLLGSGKSSSASKSAAQESLAATEMSIQNEQNMYGAAQTALAPYNAVGQWAEPLAQNIAAEGPAGGQYLNQSQQYLTQGAGYQQQAANYLQQAAGMRPPSTVTEKWLQQTPGYQFQLQQGLEQTQAAAAARGLGVSGASLKGAATYATGVADSNYQNQFNNAQTAWQDVLNQSTQAENLGSQSGSFAATALGQSQQSQAMQQQTYNQYMNMANLGENAAAMTGQAATTTGGQTAQSLATGASQYGNYLTQSGQAQAAGTSGAGNAITSGVNNYLQYSALNTLMGSGSYVDTSSTF